MHSQDRIVAHLTEGVDRNTLFQRSAGAESKSPSSRRAWIEIRYYEGLCGKALVALLTEGVDRNMHSVSCRCKTVVALLTEGVDRNNLTLYNTEAVKRRPPHGGRG